MTKNENPIGISIPQNTYLERLLKEENQNLKAIIKHLNSANYYYNLAIEKYNKEIIED